MIKGTGVDIINIERIKRIINRWGDRFLDKVFTAEEKSYCWDKSNPAQHYAARFAAKEAVFKMLGTGMRNVSWQDVNISKNNFGKPVVNLRGNAAQRASNMDIERIHISLSHEQKYAVAYLIGEGEL